VGFRPNLIDHTAAADLPLAVGLYAASEILALGKRAIVGPYKALHNEQVIRASLLTYLGLLRTKSTRRTFP